MATSTRRSSTRRPIEPLSSKVVPSMVSHEAIARRAYELFVERCREPGRDLDDWLQAERELRRAVLPRAS